MLNAAENKWEKVAHKKGTVGYMLNLDNESNKDPEPKQKDYENIYKYIYQSGYEARKKSQTEKMQKEDLEFMQKHVSKTAREGSLFVEHCNLTAKHMLYDTIARYIGVGILFGIFIKLLFI